MDEYALVRDTYDHIADAYTNRYGESAFLLSETRKFADLLPAKAKVLDLGCGSGRASNIFLKKDFDVIGVDFSEAMLALARERVPQGDFRSMDIKHLSFSEDHFDGLWSIFLSSTSLREMCARRYLSGSEY